MASRWEHLLDRKPIPILEHLLDEAARFFAQQLSTWPPELMEIDLPSGKQAYGFFKNYVDIFNVVTKDDTYWWYCTKVVWAVYQRYGIDIASGATVYIDSFTVTNTVNNTATYSGQIFFNHEAIDANGLRTKFAGYRALFPKPAKVYFDGCNVAQGGAGRGRHHANTMGEARQRTLPFGSEEPLSLELQGVQITCFLSVEQAQVPIDCGCRSLDHCHRPDKCRAGFESRDMEIVNCSLCLGAIERLSRDSYFPK